MSSLVVYSLPLCSVPFLDRLSQAFIYSGSKPNWMTMNWIFPSASSSSCTTSLNVLRFIHNHQEKSTNVPTAVDCDAALRAAPLHTSLKLTTTAEIFHRHNIIISWEVFSSVCIRTSSDLLYSVYENVRPYVALLSSQPQLRASGSYQTFIHSYSASFSFHILRTHSITSLAPFFFYVFYAVVGSHLRVFFYFFFSAVSRSASAYGFTSLSLARFGRLKIGFLAQSPLAHLIGSAKKPLAQQQQTHDDRV